MSFAKGDDLENDAVKAVDQKTLQRNDTISRYSVHDKKTTPEEAPLIANKSPDEYSDSEDEAREELEESSLNPSHPRKSIKFLGLWLWKHRVALCLGILLTGGIIGLLVYFSVFHGTEDKSVSVDTICLTPDCVSAAALIIDNLSPRYQDINPCVDFNTYACEGFNEKHDLRADQGALLASTVMAENAQRILRQVLETPPTMYGEEFETYSSAKEAIFTKLKDFYDACMDEDQVEKAGSRPLISILENIEELYPAKPRDYPTNFPKSLHQVQSGISLDVDDQITKTVAYLLSIGVTAIVDFDVSADDKNPDSVITTVAAPQSPGLPSKEYYEDPKIVAKYARTIGQVLENLLEEAKKSGSASTLPLGEIPANSAELVNKIVRLEETLAKATPDAEDTEDVTKYYNPRSAEEVKELLPQLSIPSIMTRFAPSGCKPNKLIVGSPSYLKTVSDVLKDTSSDVLQAYFVWKTVQSYGSKVEDPALKPLKRFNNELAGKDPDVTEERWRTCIKTADNSLGWILSKFYVEKAFSKEAKDFGDRIVSEIRTQFVKRLRETYWMSEEVRNLGIEKVHNIVQKIGYPIKSPDIRNSSDLQEYYKSVNITRHSFFDNAITINEFLTKQEWSALCKPTDRAQWDMTADTVNAYYSPPGNEIVFPAGIMQAPIFYNPKLPHYLSYGGFGSVSGHELSHAFDSTGRHYDMKGNYTDWWDDKTVNAFENKTHCFIDQYHDFTVKSPDGDKLHVNGKLTLGENIADAGGINAAFAAWRQSESKNPSQLLPGLQEFSKEQLFFISYASFWCGKIRPEKAVDLIYRDAHSPAWARILGTTSNSPNFKRAFNCPVKEPTCEIW